MDFFSRCKGAKIANKKLLDIIKGVKKRTQNRILTRAYVSGQEKRRKKKGNVKEFMNVTEFHLDKVSAK